MILMKRTTLILFLLNDEIALKSVRLIQSNKSKQIFTTCKILINIYDSNEVKCFNFMFKNFFSSEFNDFELN